MLSRIYGTGWLNRKQLDAHLHRLEEAAKRDHRKLGQEMDLFHLQQEAHGSVFWHPRGYMVWRELEAYMRSEEHTSELQSLMRISYAVFCLKKQKDSLHNPCETTLSYYT